MSSLPDLTAVARLIGDPARLKMLAALHTKGELTAGDLATVAGITRQTASSHLSKLQQGGLITRAYGARGTYGTYGARHRVFRLLDDDVIRAVTSLVALATVEPGEPRVISKHDATLCYGHLGGTLGNALFMALLGRSLLEPVVRTLYDYQVTAEGTAMLRNFGIDTAVLRKQRRNFARRCLNAPEANAHLSGSLADALLKELRERRWVKPDNSLEKVLVLTEAGRDGLAGHFALRL